MWRLEANAGPGKVSPAAWANRGRSGADAISGTAAIGPAARNDVPMNDLDRGAVPETYDDAVRLLASGIPPASRT